MRLDFKSLAFGYSLENGVSTPAWETALGQGQGYKLKDISTIDELVKGMIYKAVQPKSISFKKGRGGIVVTGDADNASLVIAAVFDKIFINEHEIHGGNFILLISKDDSPSHSGRLKLKYGPDNTYKNSNGDVLKNQDFINLAAQQLGLSENACWFIYDISVEKQDTLRMRAISVNEDGPMVYADSSALHSAWDTLIDADLPLSGVDSESTSQSREIEVIADKVPDDLSIEDLGTILKLMYNDAIGGKVSAIHMFGLKYGEVIENNNYSTAEIIRIAGISDSYNVEVSKGISIYKVIKDNEYGIRFYEGNEDLGNIVSTKSVFDFKTIPGKAINKIFFGTPGCGKSYYIEHDILGKDKQTNEYVGEYKKENVVRTTFYQDYSNTDFVGQILPKIIRGQNGMPDTVEYVFNPGPFTLALIKAISNPEKKVALVVEEINRGNAPAIFGDIFQLLDRDEEGISEYGIVNVSVMDYLNDYEFEVNGEKKKYIFKEIKIPGNLYIFATMNTSDQNVYTLDTAFVRRWDKEKIKNFFTGCKFASFPVPGMELYTWKEFVEGINKCIANHLEDLQVNEDKQIGAFFVKESLLKSKDAEKFAYKVFDYLWSDVAKLDHGVFFNPYDTLEDLIVAFKSKGVGVFKTGIFAEKQATLSQIEEQTQEDDSNE